MYRCSEHGRERLFDVDVLHEVSKALDMPRNNLCIIPTPSKPISISNVQFSTFELVSFQCVSITCKLSCS